ncbi:hypothetical protein [Nonomuraea sp. PA05]|uniref:hypothetical protein n=1 Tax=Nonomuraea sp. PA05 TaxID=2604466 RepID=UPI001652B3A8|nr:hypothetical protein [Nonomuraea sp. PA05]
MLLGRGASAPATTELDGIPAIALGVDRSPGDPLAARPGRDGLLSGKVLARIGAGLGQALGAAALTPPPCDPGPPHEDQPRLGAKVPPRSDRRLLAGMPRRRTMTA